MNFRVHPEKGKEGEKKLFFFLSQKGIAEFIPQGKLVRASTPYSTQRIRVCENVEGSRRIGSPLVKLDSTQSKRGLAIPSW